MQRNITGKRFEKSECRKHGWTLKRSICQAKFRLRDAIKLNFDTDRLEDYTIHNRPFVMKHDALDKKGTPIEIKKYSIIKNGKKVSIPFSEYLSIKSYADVYKMISQKKGYPFYYYWGKKRCTSYAALYAKEPFIIPVKKIKLLTPKQKKVYYLKLTQFCKDNGVCDMFNEFVNSKDILKIFYNWCRNFRNAHFYLDCKNGIYHGSQLTFDVRPVRSH
jgi:hypothetical protein